MSNLDDKLREILNSWEVVDVELAIAQIKKCFEDEGWVQAASLIKDNNLMTGNKWYDRFYGELDRQDTNERVLAAAKRASGIDNE